MTRIWSAFYLVRSAAQPGVQYLQPAQFRQLRLIDSYVRVLVANRVRGTFSAPPQRVFRAVTRAVSMMEATE